MIKSTLLPQAFDCRPCRGGEECGWGGVGWGALARSIDKILTMEELKEKSPLSHRRTMLTSQKKKTKALERSILAISTEKHRTRKGA